MDESAKVQELLNNPPLPLAGKRFLLTCPDDVVAADEKEMLKGELFESIKQNDMLLFYTAICDQFKWPKDDALVKELQERIDRRVQELKDKVKDAQENLGESEVREGLLQEAEYYSRIGDKERAVEAYRVTLEKTVGLGEKLDVVFSTVRLGLFWRDDDLTSRSIERAKDMLVSGGDWDRRNRSKVYEGLHLMGNRQWDAAAALFLETLATFTCVELFDYNTFIFYTVVLGLVTLPRPELKKRVIDSPEILSGINETPSLAALLNSFYNLEYRTFFVALADITERLKRDRYLSAMAGYFCREMRVKAYCQLLESYRSLKLALVAEAFGVSVEFIDEELSRFINAGRVNCKIDAVRGIVETTRRDSKNAQYQATLKTGDNLMHRIQKLSRVI